MSIIDRLFRKKGLNPSQMQYAFMPMNQGQILQQFDAQRYTDAYQDNADVYAGIMKVKSLPLFVTSSSKNLIHELKKYKWKTDMNGKVIDKEPVKMDDHLVDAMRYAVFTKLKQPRLTWGVI